MDTSQDRGASAVEYAVLVAGIAAVILVIVFAVGTFVGGWFQDTCDAVAQADPTSSCAP